MLDRIFSGKCVVLDPTGRVSGAWENTGRNFERNRSCHLEVKDGERPSVASRGFVLRWELTGLLVNVPDGFIRVSDQALCLVPYALGHNDAIDRKYHYVSM